MTDHFTIAIDGPAGSGKSTAAKGVATRLGFGYLDTGAMYRAVAVGCLRHGVDHDDPAAIAAYCESMDLQITTDAAGIKVTLEGDDVTRAIREPAVSAWVSAVAQNPACRANLVLRQQRIITQGYWVLEGRDTTTVVAPSAQVRVLLQADPATRLARRGGELRGALSQQELEDQVLRRDRDDSALVNFETPADGVVLIDSTHLTREQVVDAIVELAKENGLGV